MAKHEFGQSPNKTKCRELTLFGLRRYANRCEYTLIRSHRTRLPSAKNIRTCREQTKVRSITDGLSWSHLPPDWLDCRLEFPHPHWKRTNEQLPMRTGGAELNP